MQVLTDAQWAKFEAAIAAAAIRGARPRREERRTIEAIIWRLDNGAKWAVDPGRARLVAPQGAQGRGDALRQDHNIIRRGHRYRRFKRLDQIFDPVK